APNRPATDHRVHDHDDGWRRHVTTVGRVGGAWRFPVKSLQGEAVEGLTFDAAGAVGDRVWGIVDRATGKVLTAKRRGALLTAAARLDGDGTVVLTLPGGAEHVAGDPGTDAALSAWLDRDVTLARPPAESTPYELTMDPTDDGSEVWDFATPAGSFVDLAAAHLLTDASLAAARALHPGGDWDVRRFRPSLLVEVGDIEVGDAEGAGTAGFVEDAWVGGVVHCGGAGFAPFMPTPRCAMPTRAQPGLARDTEVSRTLTERHANNLGVYAQIHAPGSVRVGDPVTLA
ncbi:MAG TPA: MOSC N-terminal beta barrel domain-containing protein, partial [Acidimicrobiales bacterium]|nr:MOSC N-terminal beta barrel domain-containing protein [Acidimicrobiales bacterium]